MSQVFRLGLPAVGVEPTTKDRRSVGMVNLSRQRGQKRAGTTDRLPVLSRCAGDLYIRLRRVLLPMCPRLSGST